ncbi:MAG: polysaccharide biosynthesis C-terminal domain-containing protein [Pseudarcicella sp.]|nr:polysaccharide biosynthesis C-terminal domain-containing protein [Pseudarcicella sp.]MBP6411560.1 polysaccharide biosynthesis C-terminal domain-containing protein [Pseudarcicella sp.]
MSVFKKLASDSVLYGISTIVGRTVNFILTPLYTGVFTDAADQAAQTELYVWVGLLNVLYTYGLETSFFRFAGREKEKTQHFFNIMVTALLISSCVFSAMFIIFDTAIINALGYPGQEKYIHWLAIVIAIDSVMAIPFARLRLENKAKKFVKIRILYVLVNVLLNFFFVLFCKNIYESGSKSFISTLVNYVYDPELKAGYLMLTNLLANLLLIPLLWRTFIGFKLQWDKAQFKQIWVFSFPILIMGLAGLLNQSFDRMMLKSILPSDFYTGRTAQQAIGIYGQCYKLAALISLAIMAFKYAADPFFFSKAKDKNTPEVLAKVTKWFTIVCLLMWVFICLNLDEVGKFFLRSAMYREGLGVVPSIMLGQIFIGIFYNIGFWFKLTDNNRYATYITLIGAAINIVLNLVFIPQFGYMACAYAFMISGVYMMVACYVLGKKRYPVAYDVYSFLGYLGAAILLVWCSSFIHISNVGVAIVYHFVLFVCYLLGVIFVERKTILPLKIREKYRFLA